MADINSLVDNMKDEFKNEHDYLSEDEVDRLYNKALGIYLDISFPYAHEIVAIPENRPRAVGWVRDCMQEILERNGGLMLYLISIWLAESSLTLVSGTVRQISRISFSKA